MATSVGGVYLHFACVTLDEVACPSFGGTATVATPSVGTTLPSPPSTYSIQASGASSASPVTITNYVALSATHMACMALNGSSSSSTSAEPPNGVLVPPLNGNPPNGLNMKSVLDGTSKTIIVCETKEQCFNSWYDGTVAWTVGNNGSLQLPATSVNSKNPTATPPILFWSVPSGSPSAINVGPRPQTPGNAFNTATTGSGGAPGYKSGPWQWGPSSDHAGGVIIHLACDASVHSITEDIDPSLYLQLITRSGGEPVTLPDVTQ